jgi:predicted nucleotide-binding protein
MQPYEELFELAKRLNQAASVADSIGVTQPLEALENAANEVKRSFSGSWLGYHSDVYYAGLKPPPPRANFSQELGLKEMLGSLGSRGDWRQFDPEDVKAQIRELAKHPDIEPAGELAEKAVAIFGEAKSEILSILEGELEDSPDGFVSRLKTDLEQLEPMSIYEVAEHWRPKGAIMTRDTTAMGQGTRIPPHIEILAEITAIQRSFSICKAAAQIATKAASHLERKSRKRLARDRIGTNVFIGHGRSSAWRELKDFVQDRLNLPWDEFNRVPAAGVTNIARLSEMLDAAAIALLVMTAEDEMVDGAVQARMNVVHEAGLFQGRLGFTKAIVLLEQGCEEFSNIQGLGQIRFPKGNISASFEEVRRVLEREGLLGGE